MDEKKALALISSAAGLAPPVGYPPSLRVLETSAINAFVVGRSPGSAVIGVTRGFIKRIPRDEMLAVFAHLLARIRNRDSRTATVMIALMAPIWAMRERDYRRMDDLDKKQMRRFNDPGALGALGLREFFLIISGLIIPHMLLITLGEALAVRNRDDQIRLAEYADAEGMMLLRDPRSMLRAMEHILPLPNCIGPKGDRYAPLFFCWPGDIPEDEVELGRVSRMRQVLGAEGLEREQPDTSELFPPPAPRLEA